MIALGLLLLWQAAVLITDAPGYILPSPAAVLRAGIANSRLLSAHAAVTGGENGLGGIVRPDVIGFRLENNATFYGLVAVIGFVVVYLLWRFHRSPAGHVLIAIRENEQRAQFIGYPTNRYKLVAFTLSATLTGLAGCLLLFNNRMTSAEPMRRGELSLATSLVPPSSTESSRTCRASSASASSE